MTSSDIAERKRSSNSNPHLLFDRTAYSNAQTELIDSFVPELVHAKESVQQLNSTKQFDEMLFHLEYSFTRNAECEERSQYVNSYLKIPTPGVLHILLTLASKAPGTNWTREGSSSDAFTPTSDYVQSVNSDYDASMYKPPLSVRSGSILRKYIASMRSLGASLPSESAPSQLYENFLRTFGDLIIRRPCSLTRPQFKQSSPNKKKRPHREIASSKSGPLDITAMLKTSPRKKQSSMDENDDTTLVSTQEDPENPSSENYNPTSDDGNDDRGIISDSEDDGNISLTRSMMEEVRKYKNMSSPHTSKSHRVLESAPSGMGSSLFRTMDKAYTPEPYFSSIDSSASSGKDLPTVLDFVSSIKIFNDSLLALKLKQHKSYSLWNLIQWACWCADKSSECQKYLFNSSSTSYHVLYTTYRNLISAIFEFLTYNFVHELNRLLDLKETDGWGIADPMKRFTDYARRKEAVSSIINTDGRFLVSLLFTQLGIDPDDWYDRTVEFLFTGLGIPSNVEPQPCYEGEKFFIRHDGTLKSKIKDDEIEYDDNLDSMSFRYDMLLLFFYRSLIHDGDQTNPLCSRTLIDQISKKLLAIDYKYLKGFFDSRGRQGSTEWIPDSYQHRFLDEITVSLILKITNLAEAYCIFSAEDEANVQSLEDLLVMQDIYSVLIEDETYDSWNEFEQVWLKLNFLVAQYFCRQASRLKQNNMSTKLDCSLKKVDEQRVQFYNDFIDRHCIENSSIADRTDYNFSLTPAQASALKIDDITKTPWSSLDLLGKMFL